MRTDIAIIGAGPSGAWTAYLLARRGARVIVADPSHPREKPCGGGVTGRALAIVSSAVRTGSLAMVPVRTARFRGAGGDASVPLTAPCFDSAPALAVASRREFDALLLSAAREAGVALL